MRKHSGKEVVNHSSLPVSGSAKPVDLSEMLVRACCVRSRVTLVPTELPFGWPRRLPRNSFTAVTASGWYVAVLNGKG